MPFSSPDVLLQLSGHQLHGQHSTTNIRKLHSEKLRSIKDIEDIQMFLLNMAFISSSEVENIYIS